MKYYTWENVVYGQNKIIKAFQPLKLIKILSEKYALVKKCGKGQRIAYMIDKSLLFEFCPWE